MLLESQNCQLALIDFQERLLPALHEGGAALAQAVKLAKIAQLLRIPIVGTEQSPAKLGGNAPQIKALCLETLEKTHFDACADGLGEWLRESGTPKASPNARSLPKHLQKPAENARNSIVLAGAEAHICLLQTALSLLEEEFEVWVVTDACASRTERNRDAAFDRLAGEGVALVTLEMVAFEWLGHSEHPQFRAVQALIK